MKMIKNKTLLDGWIIDSCLMSGSHGTHPFAINIKYGLEIGIPNKHLKVFGFYVAGCEAGIIGEYRTDNIDEQKIILREIIDEHLNQLNNYPDYLTIDSYLKNIYKSKSKIEKDSINRTLKILDDNFQDLYKFQKENNNKEKQFKQ